MTAPVNLSRAPPRALARSDFLLMSGLRNKGGTAVDLALKWNVLAVFAVFVFVGAILLGAF